MKYSYVHLPQNEDIGFEGRSYSATEHLLEYNNRQVLYLYVEASDVTFCDRSYALHLVSINVKGYVVRWKCKTNDEGQTMSEIVLIQDEGEKRAIGGLLRSIHSVATISFQ